MRRSQESWNYPALWKRLEWMISWQSCSIVITFDADEHLDDDNRASLCDYSACNTVAGWWELTWDDQGVWEISLCIFGNVFFLPKMWEMWFPPKNTRLIFYSQFLPSKSNIEGWQKTNRKCRKCCASFPFWYRHLTIEETFTFPVFSFHFSSVFHLSLLPMSLVSALGMNVDIVVLYEDSRAKLSLVITKTLRQRRN